MIVLGVFITNIFFRLDSIANIYEKNNTPLYQGFIYLASPIDTCIECSYNTVVNIVPVTITDIYYDSLDAVQVSEMVTREYYLDGHDNIFYQIKKCR